MIHLNRFNENKKSDLFINVEDVFQDLLDKGEGIIGQEIKASGVTIITVQITLVDTNLDKKGDSENHLLQIENTYKLYADRIKETRYALDTLQQISSGYQYLFHISEGSESKLFLTIW